MRVPDEEREPDRDRGDDDDEVEMEDGVDEEEREEEMHGRLRPDLPCSACGGEEERVSMGRKTHFSRYYVQVLADFG